MLLIGLVIIYYKIMIFNSLKIAHVGLIKDVKDVFPSNITVPPQLANV
jgi:hypothetical protein